MRVSQVLSSSWLFRDELSELSLSDEFDVDEDDLDRSEMGAVVPASEQLDEMPELMLDGTSLSWEEATANNWFRGSHAVLLGE